MWENLRSAGLAFITIAAMVSIIPLMVWGGTGDWRRALQALREYLGIWLWALIVVGWLAAWVTLMEFIDR